MPSNLGVGECGPRLSSPQRSSACHHPNNRVGLRRPRTHHDFEIGELTAPVSGHDVHQVIWFRTIAIGFLSTA
jgi:hypothetical protein